MPSDCSCLHQSDSKLSSDHSLDVSSLQEISFCVRNYLKFLDESSPTAPSTTKQTISRERKHSRRFHFSIRYIAEKGKRCCRRHRLCGSQKAAHHRGSCGRHRQAAPNCIFSRHYHRYPSSFHGNIFIAKRSGRYMEEDPSKSGNAIQHVQSQSLFQRN